MPAILLASCAVGPNFITPDAPAASRYTREPQLVSTESTRTPGGNSQSFSPGSDVSGIWWTLFRSRKLTGFVDEAVRNHPDIQSAESALRAARETALADQGRGA
ncbi:hypothetical protein IVB46_19570 [Bradyrhizobium sp. 61]|uniref:hypothetical protein n=1 Tax=unclassified Bradyrhizobium TaxID=2631580 RepID=UPI001FFA3DF9|nr:MULTISPECIES: hypothetical protein [unclassified Bradyrhizobium]MCK1277425.1 hypothetical protein [Bradyrhizobium sp. 61]MCK1447411.1 hypothetical protein [Bradyrhizobium sp. 48]MCK1465623.1 hypothetical protein [Bradyrhizobium sp. 2]